MEDEPYDVFISYERDHDSPRVYGIVSLLEILDPGLRIFVDRRDIPNGQQFDTSIEREAVTARMVLGALSCHAARSRKVAWECAQAHSRGALAAMLVGPKPARGDWDAAWHAQPWRTQYIDLSRFKREILDPSFCDLAQLIAERLDRSELRNTVARLGSSLVAHAREALGDAVNPDFWVDHFKETDSLDALICMRTAFPDGPIREAIDRRALELARSERENGSWPDGVRRGEMIDVRAGGGTCFRDAPGLPTMVTIPTGSFNVGAAAQGESRLRQIRIEHRFATAQNLLTFAEWDFALKNKLDQFVPEPERKDSHGLDRDRYPLFGVSWMEASGYCLWATRFTGKRYRLLSEGEWEYCCRATALTMFHFGDRLTNAQANFGCSREVGQKIPVTPVGSFPPNKFQLFDMHGNLWEWVEDAWQTDADDIPASGRARIGGSKRLRTVRGGSWANYAALLASTSRSFRDLAAGDDVTGLRVARDL
jgi:formylglycine-generating enzyme required for sulfatase activity